MFDASPTEVADLLSYVRSSRSHVLSTLLAGDAIDLALDTAMLFPPADRRVALAPRTGHLTRPIEVLAMNGDLVGFVSPADHSDAELIRSTGMPIDVLLDPDATRITVSLS